MQYYKYTINEVNEFVNKFSEDLSMETYTELWNKFNSEHYYATCTHCGTEYLYSESPILENDVWNDIIENLHLTDFQKNIKSERHYYHLKGVEYGKIYHLQTYLKSLLSVTPSEKHCTLCVDCMENALHRPLRLSDINTRCKMGQTFAINKKWI